jgi:signal transduction histidine kinase
MALGTAAQAPAGALWWSGWVVALAALAAAGAMRWKLARRAELVARACHEVRGPLTAARLGLHGLARAGDLVARVAAIDLELRRAALALDDLHAAGRGAALRDRLEPVDLAGLVAEAAAAWAPVAAELGRELVVDVPSDLGAVIGDRVRLAQACGNLLANAVEHGAGPVVLRGRVEGASVRLEVVDEGRGLPAPVATLAARARRGRGHRGRGLAIAATIAARHGGRLSAAPSATGARVVLELPAAREAPAAEATR